MGNRIFVIGASLSGIDALCELVSQLPADFPAPIFVVQHVAAHSPGMLPRILQQAGALAAGHPRTGDALRPGRIYVAPPDRHMLLRRRHIALSHGPHENLSRPSVDALFRSAAINFGPLVVGIVLTGQLNDGTAGLLAIKDRGGTAIVQDPLEATAPSMPQSAIRRVPIDHRCKLAEMGALLTMLANDDPAEDGQSRVERLMEIEDRIAEGVSTLEDWWNLEQMSQPSGFNCPDCHSALYEIRDRRLLRFRCRSGHAYSAQSLLSGQAEARESQFSAIFGALIEEATLAKRMLQFPAEWEDADELRRRIDMIEREAERVSEWLHATAGLVEPEPRK